jgi:hypothetical protein
MNFENFAAKLNAAKINASLEDDATAKPNEAKAEPSKTEDAPKAGFFRRNSKRLTIGAAAVAGVAALGGVAWMVLSKGAEGASALADAVTDV